MRYQRVPITCDPLLDGFEIDTNGVVYGKRGHPLKTSTNHGGYSLVIVDVNGKSVGRSVHRLVALQFLPNKEQKPTVNHKDGNRQNNVITNLEWATLSEQQKHAFRVLGKKSHNARKIVGMNLDTGEKIKFASCAEAGRFFNKRRCTIDFVIQGKKPTCAGHVWIIDSGDDKENIRLLEEKRKSLNRVCFSQKVGMFGLDGVLIKTFQNAHSTRADGFCDRIVLKCCKQEHHYEKQYHKGFYWRFL